MTKIVQLIEMGGLKGVAKRSLREKTLAVTVNRGWVFPAVNPGVVLPFPCRFKRWKNTAYFPSFVPSFVPAVIVWDNIAL
jgi:hypothetical protein